MSQTRPDSQAQSQLHSSDLLVGQLIRLGAPRADEDDVVARWTADPEYHRMLDDQPIRPRSADYLAAARKEKNKDTASERNRFQFRIGTLAEDRLVGFAAISVFWLHQNAWISIAIGEPEDRDRGFGTDAMRLLVGYGFRELNVYKINLDVFSYNARARHVYEKCGFVLEGTQRAMLCRDGQRHDIYMMGILRPEWEALQKEQKNHREKINL